MTPFSLDLMEVKGNLKVMEHMGGDEDVEVKEKVKEMIQSLEEKEGELEDLEALNQALIVKERKSNDELQEARKELIAGTKDNSVSALIGVKRMGELRLKAIPFDFGTFIQVEMMVRIPWLEKAWVRGTILMFLGNMGGVIEVKTMSPASKSKAKDKSRRKTKGTTKGFFQAFSKWNKRGSGITASAYNPLSRTFHTLETSTPASSPQQWRFGI
ncbi:hypothetical protein IFM89_021239 [Coptis chinensis]|uniref:Uncharacterized protein n=1 Tax=Coptis chinensis TaxID=261450 RepID=A0A835GZZ1_9MAGN|nr:hypothetical protein IFM89_021239 [Coptis chinensis]